MLYRRGVSATQVSAHTGRSANWVFAVAVAGFGGCSCCGAKQQFDDRNRGRRCSRYGRALAPKPAKLISGDRVVGIVLNSIWHLLVRSVGFGFLWTAGQGRLVETLQARCPACRSVPEHQHGSPGCILPAPLGAAGEPLQSDFYCGAGMPPSLPPSPGLVVHRCCRCGYRGAGSGAGYAEPPAPRRGAAACVRGEQAVSGPMRTEARHVA